jgi:hypothetical protein
MGTAETPAAFEALAAEATASKGLAAAATASEALTAAATALADEIDHAGWTLRAVFQIQQRRGMCRLRHRKEQGARQSSRHYVSHGTIPSISAPAAPRARLLIATMLLAMA